MRAPLKRWVVDSFSKYTHGTVPIGYFFRLSMARGKSDLKDQDDNETEPVSRLPYWTKRIFSIIPAGVRPLFRWSTAPAFERFPKGRKEHKENDCANSLDSFQRIEWHFLYCSRINCVSFSAPWVE